MEVTTLASCHPQSTATPTSFKTLLEVRDMRPSHMHPTEVNSRLLHSTHEDKISFTFPRRQASASFEGMNLQAAFSMNEDLIVPLRLLFYALDIGIAECFMQQETIFILTTPLIGAWK